MQRMIIAMVPKPVLLLLASAVLGLAFLTTSSATGGGPSKTVQETVFLPVTGLRATGATLAAPMSMGHTAAIVTDASTLQPGQLIEIVGAQSEIMEVVSVSSDGNPVTVDAVSVLRAQQGTTVAAHEPGDPIYADFTRVAVNDGDVAPLPTGVTLSQALNADLGEASPAILSTVLGSADTTAHVSDASVLVGAGLGQPLAARFDGMSFVSVTNETTFLGSTGRNAGCDGSVNQSSVTVSCTTLGATPDTGPSGSGTLANVSLQVPQVTSIVNLTLSNVELVEVTVCNPAQPTAPCDPPISEDEVIGGLALIGSPAPLAPSSPPDPSTGGPSVYISPKTRSGAPSTPSTLGSGVRAAIHRAWPGRLPVHVELGSRARGRHDHGRDAWLPG